MPAVRILHSVMIDGPDPPINRTIAVQQAIDLRLLCFFLFSPSQQTHMPQASCDHGHQIKALHPAVREQKQQFISVASPVMSAPRRLLRPDPLLPSLLLHSPPCATAPHAERRPPNPPP